MTWSQNYIYPNNHFSIHWEEPEQPHDEIIGYNLYRNDEFYMFLTETSIYNSYYPTVPNAMSSNCGGIDFLQYENEDEFLAHVRVLYENGIESDYIETVVIYPPALNTENYKKNKTSFYPNPTTGILNIEY